MSDAADLNQISIVLNDAHIDAAARAMGEFRDHGTAVDAYVSLACIIIYLEAMLKINSEQSFENMLSAYKMVRHDEPTRLAVIKAIAKKMSAANIILPGTGRMN